MLASSLWIQILTVLYILTIIGTIIVVISENRNPIRTLSWVLVLTYLPVLGLVLFYFFGQSTRRKKHVSINYKKFAKEIGFDPDYLDLTEHIESKYLRLAEMNKTSSHAILFGGSDVEVITNGKTKFEKLLKDIEEAKHHIHMQYFIFMNDEIGKRVRAALMRKAEQGVEVRFLYDNVANILILPRFYNKMRKSGVLVTPFMKLRFPLLRSRVNYRNHRKLVVIDGTIAYMGGMNVGDAYEVGKKWRDTHLRIKGYGVYGLQYSFFTDWTSSDQTLPLNIRDYFPPQQVYTKNLMQVLPDGPESQWPKLMHATTRLTLTAQKYLYIQTPYFLPTESLLEALQSAALAGVDVRLMVSKRSDSLYVDPAAKSYYQELLDAGLRIFEHPNKFIHAKTIVSDDYLSVIGSANMDFRSFELNFEINCYMYDKDLALLNKEIFMADLVDCEEVKPEEWEKRPRWKKSLESVMRLFAPLF